MSNFNNNINPEDLSEHYRRIDDEVNAEHGIPPQEYHGEGFVKYDPAIHHPNNPDFQNKNINKR